LVSVRNALFEPRPKLSYHRAEERRWRSQCGFGKMTPFDARDLVSVGLPTFNRVSVLKRAIDSVLAQDYSNFELVVSDNASTDETQALCEEFCRKDQRIRYVRQSTNLGAASNFQAVLDQAQGKFFMWLGDDDWLDPSYLSKCLRIIAEHPEYELVCGRGKYFEGDKFCFAEVPINLDQDSSSQRVFSYYRQVGINGMFYGVMRRKILSCLQLQNSLGGDWLLMGQIACLGKVRTLETVFINRSIAGASQSVERLALNQGLPRIVARNAHLLIAHKIFKDIAWKSPVYKPLGRLSRISLALNSGITVARRYSFPAGLNRLVERWDNLRTRLTIRTRLKRGLRSIRRKAL
jgi:hypothetical protein